MAEHQGWIPIDEVIYAYIDEAELSEHKFFRLWHIGHRGVTELGLDFFYQIKSVKLPINSNLTVNLPADCQKWTKGGVLNDRGEIIPMGYNDKLTSYASQLPNRIEKTQDNTLYSWYNGQSPIWYNYWNGNSFGNMYGLPSGAPFVGSFKVDNVSGIILLDENFTFEYFMLEYIASPAEGDQIYIPIQFKEALISYLRWKDNISTNVKTHVSNANIGMRRHDFFNDRRLAWARYRPFKLIEAYQWSQENTRLTVKI